MSDTSYLLTLSCPNQPGIVARVTAALFSRGGNILEAHQFDDIETGLKILGDKGHRIITENDLRAVQHRREFPTRVTQRLQVFLQNRVISRVLASRRAVRAPLALRLASKSAYLRGLPARVIGLGIRPEHVRTPAAA